MTRRPVLVVVAPLLLVSCRAPTEITLQITTDIPCDGRFGGATITAGSGDIEMDPPATAQPTCTDGNVGSLVIVPGGADDGSVSIRIVAGEDFDDPEQCVAPDYTPPAPNKGGCVVARRLLSFEPHDPLYLPIALRSACVGNPCSKDQTCVEGTCVSALVPDPSACSGASSTACSEQSLVDGGAPDGGATDGGTTDGGTTDGGATDGGGADRIVQIAAGGYASCARTQAGRLYCWGGNQDGAFGDGTTSTGPVPVSRAFGAVPVVAYVGMGDRYTCVIDGEGAVWCAGLGTQGNLGDGFMMDSATPAKVSLPTGTTATLLAVGDVHACAALSNGQLVCWGDDTEGGFGNGGTQMAFSPVSTSLPAGTEIESLSAGDGSTCMVSKGTVSCWGNNSDGQIGQDTNPQPDGSDGSYLTPSVVKGVGAATSVAIGERVACAIIGTTATCWGEYPGSGAETSLLPVTLAVADPVAQLALGDHGGCALTTAKQVWCWGGSFAGQLGDGPMGIATGSDMPTPVRVASIDDAIQIAASEYWRCALHETGKVSCWGQNDWGQVTGDGDASGVATMDNQYVYQSTPVTVVIPL